MEIRWLKPELNKMRRRKRKELRVYTNHEYLHYYQWYVWIGLSLWPGRAHVTGENEGETGQSQG